jgi:hypothetical protein
MKNNIARLVLILLISGAFVAGVHAQRFEFHPYAGGFAPGTADFGEFRNEGVYGFKLGGFMTPNFQIDGNLGYLNRFQLVDVEPRSRGMLYEVGGNYHFVIGRLQPFVRFGIGGVTAFVGEDGIIPDLPTVDLPFQVVQNPLSDRDTFFMFSYGGGIKAVRLWGPLGLRGDIRGRTLPNILGDSTSWLEASGGITLSWGE